MPIDRAPGEPLRIPRETKEYLESEIEAPDDPHPDALSFAFAPSPSPPERPEIFVLGVWAAGGPPWIGRILVGGPDTGAAVELDPGRYVAYAKVTADPEAPVFRVDEVVVE